jgi:hypothetical protein
LNSRLFPPVRDYEFGYFKRRQPYGGAMLTPSGNLKMYTEYRKRIERFDRKEDREGQQEIG